ncbi:nucleotide-binding universal stress UspA family protein [Breznakibacter xylanolyticus]|uniref:Nucleotide-binding universal stress UspA family protein n=1 Tax=Breznakibacter xylanolyticus TaxID=990 RepID=A0A2W7NZX5_9BACT|nr:universal stress protein [Breznakibacter xylanolyticus]MBN2744569.1 universal stress protein [Marinilabiliaceae bacterium]PZX16762.1 nucleotide-binding universal stress UspA family protein [Breznakibacter xylanolyticus]
MNTTNNKIVVPYDFTEIADNAIAHAINYSKTLNTGITLLHIVKSDVQTSEWQSKLDEVAEKVEQQFGQRPIALVREGNIFKSIQHTAEEMDALIVIMGTHGMKGLQKLTGSWALKVIVGSRVPFIVVQEPPIRTSVEKIVFPIDFKSENKEKLKWVEFLSHYLKTKIYLLSYSTKEGAVDSRTKANVVFAKKFLDEKEINYELAIGSGGGSFSQETIQFSKRIEADMIIAMTTRDIAFHDYVLGAQEQYIIANEAKIPVLVVNPRNDLMKYGYGFM